ncbi:MAG TPA: lipopolysaccharide biosynthesis protein [Acetobacteraceae bacterium]|jgi:O-antigen/teichoic acid export membrane protein|nr:lipopolysaccharide biosynthesis protein [Acetobacteraceae bacterium]
MKVTNGAAPREYHAAPPSRERSAHATLWTLVELGGGQGASFLIFLVMARTIGPADYGIFTLALSLLILVTVVQYYGFADAIIQRTEIDASFLDTVFWCDVLLSLCLVALAQVAAHPAARLFASPLLEPLIRVLSLVCLLQALVTVPTALYRRALRIQVLAARTALSYIIGGGVGIVMALRGYGVWALAVSQLVQYVVIFFVLNSQTEWRPGLRFRYEELRELVHFAGHFMFANGLKVSADRISQLAVGLFADPVGVGCYALALRIVTTASGLTNQPVERVTLPVLSRFVNDLPIFRETYRKMILVVNSVWAPAAAGLGVSAPVLVRILFGEHWAPAGPVLQAMCFTAPTLGLWILNGQALSALGQPERFTRLALAQVVLACVAFPIASYFGIVAAGAAWSLLSLVMVPLNLLAIKRACDLPLRPILSDWLRVTGSTGAMLAVTWAISERLQAGIASLAAGLFAGALVYLLLLQFVLMPGYVGRMLSLLRNAASPDRPATPHP